MLRSSVYLSVVSKQCECTLYCTVTAALMSLSTLIYCNGMQEKHAYNKTCRSHIVYLPEM